MPIGALETTLLVIYFGVLLVLSMYGTHRYYMAYLYHRYRHNRRDRLAKSEPSVWPAVTVQLPVFNERYVVERLIDAVCQFDYPRDRLSIQVLDDSTDDTVEISGARVQHWKAQGLDIELIHRSDRTGYKAGALAHGATMAKGEFIAVFDADFVPEPDFLRHTVPHFEDPGIGMVQVRWGHINREFSPLTQAQAILLDGHFVIEHSARNRSGRFFNFNGTAGIWRKSTIVDAGGWQHDTLTEDLDLSYRAQLRGWRFVYLQDIVSPGEVPVDINAFKSQQHRWAKGSAQTALKLLPRLFRSDLPLPIKVEAFFHLTANFSYPLLVVLSILMPLAIMVRARHSLTEILLLDVPCFMAATMSMCTFYAFSQREIGEGHWKRLKYIPFVMSVGIGLSLSNAKAVLEAFMGHDTPFLRTPKHGVINKGEKWKQKRYRGNKSILPWLELGLGLYYTVTIFTAIDAHHWASLPFLFIFQAGFLYVGIVSLMQLYGFGTRDEESSEEAVESETPSVG